MNLSRCLALGVVFANLGLAQPALVGSIAGHPNWPGAKKASDVDTVDHLLASLYDVISGPAGKPRDWDRFRSLFVPDGRLAVIRNGDAVFLTPEMYVERDDPYFKTHGFFERGITNRVEEFGNLVQAWSTYESRRADSDRQPFARGVNSLQVVHAQGRFWVASIIFGRGTARVDAAGQISQVTQVSVDRYSLLIFT